MPQNVQNLPANTLMNQFYLFQSMEQFPNKNEFRDITNLLPELKDDEFYERGINLLLKK